MCLGRAGCHGVRIQLGVINVYTGLVCCLHKPVIVTLLLVEPEIQNKEKKLKLVQCVTSNNIIVT